ncbi:MAG: LysE family transporter, partial [Acidilobus sp.]
VMIGLAAYQLRWALSLEPVRLGLGLAMGAFIAYFTATTLRDGVRALRGAAAEVRVADDPRGGPLMAGFLLTALNPFFLLWWLTVGLLLIEAASAMGLVLGYSIMYPSHVWMDYAWLAFVASMGEGGRKALSGRGYGVLLVALSLVMAGAGAYALLGLMI